MPYDLWAFHVVMGSCVALAIVMAWALIPARPRRVKR